MYISNPNAAVTASDITKFGGVAVSTGTGVGGAGIPRVTAAIDSFVAPVFVTGPVLTVPAADKADYTPDPAAVAVIFTNTDASQVVYLRDQVATGGVKGIGLNPGASITLPTTAALRLTNGGASSVVVTVNELRSS